MRVVRRESSPLGDAWSAVRRTTSRTPRTPAVSFEYGATCVFFPYDAPTSSRPEKAGFRILGFGCSTPAARNTLDGAAGGADSRS